MEKRYLDGPEGFVLSAGTINSALTLKKYLKDTFKNYFFIFKNTAHAVKQIFAAFSAKTSEFTQLFQQYPTNSLQLNKSEPLLQSAARNGEGSDLR